MNEIVPHHVVIVMDGNGRWAHAQGLARIEGHKAGVDAVKKIVTACLKKQIACLSLFAFSSENWSRPSEEVNFLMGLFLDALKKEIKELSENGVRMRFTGDRAGLSPALQQQMQDAECFTQANTQLILNIVVNYGGKWDIVSASKKLLRELTEGSLSVDEINESHFANHLDTAGLPEPDLFIRTSGELRISNFFLWQLAYTELYFTEIYWPDFDEHQFDLALDSYRKRKRRFGLV